MMETLSYYVELVAALCGFDGNEAGTVFGYLMVSMASMIVVYAFYQAITKTLWPGEEDTGHIKYRVLDDNPEENRHAN